jgi:hypothetical protein
MPITVAPASGKRVRLADADRFREPLGHRYPENVTPATRSLCLKMKDGVGSCTPAAGADQGMQGYPLIWLSDSLEGRVTRTRRLRGK